MKQPIASLIVLAVVLLLSSFAGTLAAQPFAQPRSHPWQQVARELTFVLAVERERFDTNDRAAQLAIAVETGKSGAPLNTLSVDYQLLRDGKEIARASSSIAAGLISVEINLADLAPGGYQVQAQLMRAGAPVKSAQAKFTIVSAPVAAQSGRIPLVFPIGVDAGVPEPLSVGVPFPKGALTDPARVRVVDDQGHAVPAQVSIRSRWGPSDRDGIRWLGVDFQAASQPAYWPQKTPSRLFLEYGPGVSPVPSGVGVSTVQKPGAIEVSNGRLSFTVRQHPFTLLDDVVLDGRKVHAARPGDGLYLVDHQGAVYRAANDRQATLTIEESGPLKTVIRAEGWYVRDGAQGALTHWTLPTDRLCKFIVRIECHAGQPYVRLLSTWVVTYDTFSVRLKDLGLRMSVPQVGEARLGVEGAEPLAVPIGPNGARLVQHRHDAFVVEAGDGKSVAAGARSAGWMAVPMPNGWLGLSHRETWQRFPKEFEALPGEAILHLWPAHGKTNPDIDELARDQIHKLWFAHQGTEMNLRMPWSYYLATAKYADTGSTDIYKAGGTAIGGVYSGALGAAVTSEVQIHFAQSPDQVRNHAQRFQRKPHALADPEWACATGAMGYIRHHDAKTFPQHEETIENLVKGYSEAQDRTGEFGMFLYRVWHHGWLNPDGTWNLYRLYNATHHYEAYLPWMLYARSGDPFYLTQGRANMRQLTDMQVLHYEDRSYPAKEFYTGQKRLIGSVKHDNGFVPWGGDHAILGHPTCYNGMILAYYLTGDPRFKDVVEEWQSTLLTRRDDPEFADRSIYPGRDNNNAVGEIADLYLFSHDPRLLAYLPERMARFESNLYDWGLAVHNAVILLGSSDITDKLVRGIGEQRTAGGRLNFANPGAFGVWRAHAPMLQYALADLIDPSLGASVEAALELRELSEPARKFRFDRALRSPPLHDVIDNALFMPTALAALGKSPGAFASLDQLDRMQALLPPVIIGYKVLSTQTLQSRVEFMEGRLEMASLLELNAMPMSDTGKEPGLHAVVLKEADRDFNILIRGTVDAKGLQLKVIDPDGQVIKEAQVPQGVYRRHAIAIPKDGKTGQYCVVIIGSSPGGKSDLFVPVTDLDKEVYVMQSQWQDTSRPGAFSRFFTRSPGQDRYPITLNLRGFGAWIDPVGNKLIDCVDPFTQPAPKPQAAALKADLTPSGLWLVSYGRSYTPDQPLILSVSPAKWFNPAPQSTPKGAPENAGH